jgi:hypothetical protein
MLGAGVTSFHPRLPRPDSGLNALLLPAGVGDKEDTQNKAEFTPPTCTPSFNSPSLGVPPRIYVKYNVVVLFYFFNFLRFAHSPNEKIDFHG